MEGSDALLGFTNRGTDHVLADQVPLAVWPTHRWARDELAIAHTKLPIAEVGENGVDPQFGILGDLQWISNVDGNRHELLVEIAKTSGLPIEN
jgi:hypothetical protein